MIQTVRFSGMKFTNGGTPGLKMKPDRFPITRQNRGQPPILPGFSSLLLTLFYGISR